MNTVASLVSRFPAQLGARSSSAAVPTPSRTERQLRHDVFRPRRVVRVDNKYVSKTSSRDTVYETALYVEGALRYRRAGGKALAPLPLPRARNVSAVETISYETALRSAFASGEPPSIDAYVLDLEAFTDSTSADSLSVLTEVEVNVRLAAVAAFQEAYIEWHDFVHSEYVMYASWPGCSRQSLIVQVSARAEPGVGPCTAQKVAFVGATLVTIQAGVSAWALMGMPEPFITKIGAAKMIGIAKFSAGTAIGLLPGLIDCIRSSGGGGEVIRASSWNGTVLSEHWRSRTVIAAPAPSRFRSAASLPYA